MTVDPLGEADLGCDDLAVTDLLEASPTPAQRRHLSRRFWLVLATIAALVTGGAITAVAVSFYYLHAHGLQAGGSFGWLPPDNLRTRFVQHDGYDAMVIPARPNHWQTFSVQVHNPSSVTQTILGLATVAPTAEPERLTVSTTSTAVGDEMRAHYTSEPVAIPPDGIRTVRFSTYAGSCSIWGHGNGRGEYVTGLSLRVRVGAFTRTEDVDFGGQSFELHGTAGAC